MKSTLRGVMITVSILCLLAFGYWAYSAKSAQADSAGSSLADGPVASVKVAPIKKATISSLIRSYGEVVPAPGAIQVVSMPYEIRVNRIMVSTGQKVSEKDELIELEPSPDTLLRLEQAKNSCRISRERLDHMKQLFSLKLATNAQILKTEEAFKQASLRLESLKKRGVGGKKIIRAGVSGLISGIKVREGAIVPAGDPLMEIVAQNRLEVRLGVEAEDAVHLSSGRRVSLFSVNEPARKAVAGRIRKVSQAINPTTRLVDVFVTLPVHNGFLLGEYIVGSIAMVSSYGMVVPRNTVLPEKGKNVLYTVLNGHAVKHLVKIGIESGNRVEVSGGGLRPGDNAVVLGNYELKDGMAVKVESTR